MSSNRPWVVSFRSSCLLEYTSDEGTTPSFNPSRDDRDLSRVQRANRLSGHRPRMESVEGFDHRPRTYCGAAALGVPSPSTTGGTSVKRRVSASAAVRRSSSTSTQTSRGSRFGPVRPGWNGPSSSDSVFPIHTDYCGSLAPCRDRSSLRGPDTPLDRRAAEDSHNNQYQRTRVRTSRRPGRKRPHASTTTR
jgi:hypothetical protein